MGDFNLPKRQTMRAFFTERPFIQRKNRQGGFAVLWVVAMIALLAGIGLQSYGKAGGVSRMVHMEIQSRQALYAAEGGIEWAKHQLNVDPALTIGRITYGQGVAEIKIEKGNGGYWVTAEGKIASASRKLKVLLLREEGVWVMRYYQDIYS